MAVATKAAALGVTIRLLDVALIGESDVWAPALAALATITIVVGNVGALGQTSLKRILAYSSVAQAGYMLAGVVVANQLGVRATVFYLAVYLVMNLAAFAVIVARERETPGGDALERLAGLGYSRPLLAWPMTIAMLGLAGLPATGGFIGKFFLIQAAVGGEYAWLGVVIVIGSMISLAYYLRIVAAMWVRESPRPEAAAVAASGHPVLAGGSVAMDAERTGGGSTAGGMGGAVTMDGEQHGRAPVEVVLVAVVFAALTLATGIVPSPLLDLLTDAGSALTELFPG
jgi:NADH-quinone oxidoreductase subunit N